MTQDAKVIEHWMQDTRTVYCGVTKFQTMSIRELRELQDILLIYRREEPLAALVPYSLYLRMQELIIQADRLIGERG